MRAHGQARRTGRPVPLTMDGLPVSAGVIEGRARVILDMAQADLEAGDILVPELADFAAPNTAWLRGSRR